MLLINYVYDSRKYVLIEIFIFTVFGRVIITLLEDVNYLLVFRKCQIFIVLELFRLVLLGDLYFLCLQTWFMNRNFATNKTNHYMKFKFLTTFVFAILASSLNAKSMEYRRIIISLLSAFVMAAIPLCTKAQNLLDNIHLELGFDETTPKDDVLPIGLNFNLSYSLTNRFSVQGLSDATYFIPKDGSIYDYNKSVNVGGGIGYILLPSTEKERSTFELRASFTTTVGHSDFKNTSYKLGLYWMGNQNRRFTPVIGAGYSFRHFKGNDLNNFHGAYVSIGCRL